MAILSSKINTLLVALLVGASLCVSFPLAPVSRNRGANILRAADDLGDLSTMEQVENELVAAGAGSKGPKSQRRGVSKDQDGKSNIWSIEPTLQVDEDAAFKPTDALKILAAAAAAGGAAFAVTAGANKVDAAELFPLNAVLGNPSIMMQKEHGTSHTGVQEELRFGVNRAMADKITNYNRKGAEPPGYFQFTTWQKDVEATGGATKYYDSNSGGLLFTAPIGRTLAAFEGETNIHGWPSFRDEEVNWERVRVLNGGEVVSIDGTHLGHNLPDKTGNRYCINLVSIAGKPETVTSSYGLYIARKKVSLSENKL